MVTSPRIFAPGAILMLFPVIGKPLPLYVCTLKMSEKEGEPSGKLVYQKLQKKMEAQDGV